MDLDTDEAFVKGLPRRGVRAKVWDVREETPLPQADYAIMQASLYHFLPDPLPVPARMLEAARAQVIIAEPVGNLASAKLPLLASLARLLTDPGVGSQPHRFNEQMLDDLLSIRE